MYSSVSATRWQQAVGRSIANATLTMLVDPSTIPNALERQRRDVLQYKVQFS